MIKAHNEGKASISPIPTRINTNEFTGATLYFERVSAQSLVEAGLVSSDQIPREAFNSIVRTEAFEVRRMKDGSVTAKFKAEPFLARSTDFKRFLGSSCKTSGQSDWRLR